MLNNNTEDKLLQVFFDFPLRKFHVRELSRIINISHPSVMQHLKILQSQELVLKEKTNLYPVFSSLRENELFKVLKTNNLIQRINALGLLEELNTQTFPDVIILFGSCSFGEDTEHSDIDIFIQAKEKKLNLEKYEKLLNRKISIFFQEKFIKLSPELKNNIINGIRLSGYLKVFPNGFNKNNAQ